MKTAKGLQIPVLENAFEINLPKLMRTAKATNSSRLVLDDGDVRTVVVLMKTRLATFLGGRTWIMDIVPVQCLQGRVRPLLKCPRAHEGNFQSLYFRAGELACRHCHALRYRTNVAASAAERVRIARSKLLDSMGAKAGEPIPARQPYKWRSRRTQLLKRLMQFNRTHYGELRSWLERREAERLQGP